VEAHSVGAPGPEPVRREVVIDTYVERGPAAYVAELIGTFALVFFITMVVSLYVTAVPVGQPQPFIDWSVIGLVHAFVLFMLIQSLAVISGAHFNPAVTVALAVIRQIRPPEAFVYIVLQFAGGILGALLTKGLISNEGAGVNYGAVAVSAARLDHSVWLGAVCEGVGTFFLIWAIVGVAVNPAGLKDWAGLAIGTTLGFLVMIFGPLTGAGLNPARAFGPALVGHFFDGTGRFAVVYIIAPIIGGVIAAVAYTFVFTTPGKKGLEGMEPVG
jgi:glycerol uptake facilitator protein